LRSSKQWLQWSKSLKRRQQLDLSHYCPTRGFGHNLRDAQLRHESMRELKATMEAMNTIQYQIGRCTAEKEEARTRAQHLEEKIHAMEGELAECQQASAYARFLMQLNLPPVQLQWLQQERNKALALETQVSWCTTEKNKASTRAQRLEERICTVEGELVECQQVSAYTQLLTKLAYLLRAAAATARTQ
jgi:predicted ribosome quality control (RQC) complex YloA/Tae2 family protein